MVFIIRIVLQLFYNANNTTEYGWMHHGNRYFRHQFVEKHQNIGLRGRSVARPARGFVRIRQQILPRHTARLYQKVSLRPVSTCLVLITVWDTYIAYVVLLYLSNICNPILLVCWSDNSTCMQLGRYHLKGHVVSVYLLFLGRWLHLPIVDARWLQILLIKDWWLKK